MPMLGEVAREMLVSVGAAVGETVMITIVVLVGASHFEAFYQLVPAIC